ncbi:MAG: hypothetical protein Q4G68_13615 [Planctomycetia bacterium]|nr:hypothetical protein [Planctomycetia bacterium]
MHDRTRRFWTVLLFIIGGPLMTACLALWLVARYSSPAVEGEQARLTAALGRPVTLAGVRFVKPSETLYFGLRILNEQTGETELFCPEVLVTRLSAITLTEGPHAIKAAPGVSVGTDLTSSPFSPGDFIWIIPRAALRFSAIGTLQSDLTQAMTHPVDKANGAVLFHIRETVLYYSDAEFQQAMDAWRMPGDRRGVWRKVRASLDDCLRNRFNSQDTSVEAVQRWVTAYNENARTTTLEEVAGSWEEGDQSRELQVAFHLAAIPISEPVELTVRHEKSGEPGQPYLTVNLNAASCPLPSSFAAMFSPIFSLAGRESWFTGNVSATWTAIDGEQEPQSVYNLSEFHLKRASLSAPSKRVMAAPVRGTVADLHLTTATIDRGIFTGAGSLYTVHGQLDRRFLIKLQELLKLTFDPPESLAQRFPDDMVPFDDLAFQFKLDASGLTIDSPYPGRIIGMSRQAPGYKMYLKSEPGPCQIGFPELLPLLAPEGQDHPFWSRYGRQAITHLPTEKASEQEQDANVPNH